MNILLQQAIVAAARLQGQEAVQFMVAEYARMYENNQVIAKPPIKMPHDPTALGSALNSFYSDIATMEKTAADTEKEKMAEIRVPDLVAMPSPIVPQVQVPMMDNDTPDGTKERKKKKVNLMTMSTLLLICKKKYLEMLIIFCACKLFSVENWYWKKTKRNV